MTIISCKKICQKMYDINTFDMDIHTDSLGTVLYRV